MHELFDYDIFTCTSTFNIHRHGNRCYIYLDHETAKISVQYTAKNVIYPQNFQADFGWVDIIMGRVA